VVEDEKGAPGSYDRRFYSDWRLYSWKDGDWYDEDGKLLDPVRDAFAIEGVNFYLRRYDEFTFNEKDGKWYTKKYGLVYKNGKWDSSKYPVALDPVKDAKTIEWAQLLQRVKRWERRK